MDLYPAVDVQGGRVAHVRAGNAPRPSVYGDDPAAAVAQLAADGARWVHLVDLDRAHGRGTNAELVRAVLANATPQVQVGGSLGAEAVIGEMLEWGAARVVIGCATAATDPSLVGRLVRRHGSHRLAVAIDASEARVKPRGAATAPPLPTEDFARLIRDQGVRIVIYTDVTRDGTLTGPDIAAGQALARLGFEVVASGGVGSLPHLAAIKHAGLSGAIVGRALHEGRFTLREAMACAAD